MRYKNEILERREIREVKREREKKNIRRGDGVVFSRVTPSILFSRCLFLGTNC